MSKSHVGEGLRVGVAPGVACADGLGGRRRGRGLLVSHPGPRRGSRADGVGARVCCCCAGECVRLIQLLVLGADLGQQQRAVLADGGAGAGRRGEAGACRLCY